MIQILETKRMKNEKGYSVWYASDIYKICLGEEYNHEEAKKDMALLPVENSKSFYIEELPIKDYLISASFLQYFVKDQEQKKYFENIVSREYISGKIIEVGNELDSLKKEHSELVMIKEVFDACNIENEADQALVDEVYNQEYQRLTKKTHGKVLERRNLLDQYLKKVG